jgi:hypothetical protein
MSSRGRGGNFRHDRRPRDHDDDSEEEVVTYELPQDVADAMAAGEIDGGKGQKQVSTSGSTDPLNFQMRQAAVRALEKHKVGGLKPFDTLFVVFCLYYEDTTAAAARMIINSTLRVGFTAPMDIIACLDERHLSEMIASKRPSSHRRLTRFLACSWKT